MYGWLAKRSFPQGVIGRKRKEKNAEPAFFSLGLKVDLTGKSTLTEVGLEPQSGEPSTPDQPKRPHSATPSAVQPTREVPSVIKEWFTSFEPRDTPPSPNDSNASISPARKKKKKKVNKNNSAISSRVSSIVLYKVAPSHRRVQVLVSARFSPDKEKG